MISVETSMKDYEASVLENLQGEWIRLMKRQALLMLLWTAFTPRAIRSQPGYTDFICV
jgi:hypothetical protein